MADKIITCGMCGAFCLESQATDYEYESLNAKGKKETARAKACPRCWQGLLEHSGVAGGA